jgi:glucose-1-phosphate thymidylyltransferase
VTRSTIVGPVVIGPGTVVEDSTVGPYTAVGADCVVSRSGVEYSILLDGCAVRGIGGVYGSVIGRAAQVAPAAVSQRHRLVLGDHAQVEIAA